MLWRDRTAVATPQSNFLKMSGAVAFPGESHKSQTPAAKSRHGPLLPVLPGALPHGGIMVSAPTMEAGQGPDNYPDNIISYFKC